MHIAHPGRSDAPSWAGGGVVAAPCARPPAPVRLRNCVAKPNQCSGAKKRRAPPPEIRIPFPAERYGADGQRMLGVGGPDEFSLAQTQQVIYPHQPQNPFAVDPPSPAHQCALHAAISVDRPFQRDLLDLASQLHLLLLDLRGPQETVIARPADSPSLAQPVHRGPRFDGFPDLLVEPATPLPATGRGCSLKRRKAFFKKSFSIVSWPILRSNSAIRSASRLGWERAAWPGKAHSPLARHSPLQVCSRFGLT